MTYQSDCTLPKELLEQIAADDFEAFPELIRILIDEAMRLESEQHLGASHYERTPERRGHANGYKPKTVKTRVGALPVWIDGCWRELMKDINQQMVSGHYYHICHRGNNGEIYFLSIETTRIF
jgi:hypothetical protein